MTVGLHASLTAKEAEACSERNRTFAERVASAVQIKELCAKLRSYEAPAQSNAIVASAPPLLSLGEEKAFIHEEYARRMDRMQLGHDEVFADLQRRLERHRQRGRGEKLCIFGFDSPSSRRAPGPSSFASSTRHEGVAL